MLKMNRLCALLLLLTLGFAASAQEKFTVRGVVTDTEGQPLIGATVVEKGTTNGVAANAAGEFTLRVDLSATLEVSFLGYAPREIPAAQMTGQPIVLETNVTQIEDVVVIGYGTARKTDLTGSVVAIRADELNRGAVTSPQSLLQGKIPGVHILSGDGGPGSGSTIRIRGGSSLNATNDPLIVIDGLPVHNDAMPGSSNALAAINPNDIESFTVLKDASATAIYGSRASNGVIIITTKKGRGNTVQVSYNSSYSLSMNSKQVDMMSPQEYRDYMLNLYPEGTENGNIVRNLMGEASTTWQDQIFRPAYATDQNVSVLGNVKNRMPYRVSVGYTNENGTLKTSNSERYTADVSLSPTFFDDHLKMTLNAKGTRTGNRFADSGAVNQAAFFDPTQDIYFRKADGSIDTSIANGYYAWFSDATPNVNATRNPFSTLYDHFNTATTNRLMGNVQFDYKVHFLPELRLNLNLGLDMADMTGREGDNIGSVQSLNDTEAPGFGKTAHKKERRENRLLEFYAAYAKEIDRHRFDVMGGYSWQYFLNQNDNHTMLNTGTLFTDFPLWKTENQLLSFFGRANYSFDSRYLFTVSLRADASSRFSKENRWGYFPAAAFAWNIAEEGFLKDSRTISDLKLRLGYGETGQQDIGTNNYPYLARYNLSVNPVTSYYIDGRYVSVLKPEAYDPNIKWETTTTYNAGIDYGFFDGKLFGSLDFYFRQTRDLINTVGIPRGSNFSNVVTTNVGNMENKGVELSVGAHLINRQDLTWTVGTNVTWQSTKITKLTVANDSDYGVEMGSIGGTGNRIQLHKVGHAPYSFFTYQQVWGADGKPMQNVLVDQDGNGILTEADRYLSGKKPAPDVYFGINSRLNWRNWDFGFNGHGSFGNWVFNQFYSGNATPTGDYLTQGFLVNVANTVKKSGFTQKNENGQLASDMFLENASFFRMDDITVGYTFDELFRFRNSDPSLRLAFTVQNPFVITGYSGLDPENSGIDNNIWPRPRIYSLRVALNF
jgi:iron complex outermembrane receptor protein